jgi:hypothetical protein
LPKAAALHAKIRQLVEEKRQPMRKSRKSSAEETGQKSGRPGAVEGMSKSDAHHQRMARMTFATVYPLYVEKVEKKGRTKEELNKVTEWLTGFDASKLRELIENKVTFEDFFRQASLHPNAHLITGVICGYRVEEIENPLTRKVRYLDKLVDELAKGRKMEKILRVPAALA